MAKIVGLAPVGNVRVNWTVIGMKDVIPPALTSIQFAAVL